MQALQYIKQHGIKALTDNLGIKVRRDGDLITLNYCQIESPKTDPVVMECRGLTLNHDGTQVISRGMDRFFNLGEALNVAPEINWDEAVLFEKVDGSFIKIYWNPLDDRWEVATRGTAFASTDCMGHGITFRELVFKALGVSSEQEFQELIDNASLYPEYTYMFELTCAENRVVKHYDGYKLHYLISRDNETGVYADERTWLSIHDGEGNPLCGLQLEFPKQFTFKSAEECQRVCAELKDLDEGYVVYQEGVPVSKIKSPAYVAVHHIRGEGLNSTRCKELVLSGEVEEYLTYFPHDREMLKPYIDAMNLLDCHMDAVYACVQNEEDQKEFARKIAGMPFKAALFGARLRGTTPRESFNQQLLSYRVRQLEEYLK
jgi:hypothetical protein